MTKIRKSKQCLVLEGFGHWISNHLFQYSLRGVGKLGQGIYISYRHFWLNRLEKTLKGFRFHIVRLRLKQLYHVSII